MSGMNHIQKAAAAAANLKKKRMQRLGQEVRFTKHLFGKFLDIPRRLMDGLSINSTPPDKKFDRKPLGI